MTSTANGARGTSYAWMGQSGRSTGGRMRRAISGVPSGVSTSSGSASQRSGASKTARRSCGSGRRWMGRRTWRRARLRRGRSSGARRLRTTVGWLTPTPKRWGTTGSGIGGTKSGTSSITRTGPTRSGHPSAGPRTAQATCGTNSGESGAGGRKRVRTTGSLSRAGLNRRARMGTGRGGTTAGANRWIRTAAVDTRCATNSRNWPTGPR
mmetsp:Transcript_14958/g.34802  ORF Transcript_14958/g.34802 Transcript_14958/m.34802 type:complete len:209 (-) Transcript_14958:110-736(-)